MRRPQHQGTGGEELLVGIDLHKHRWHVTMRTVDLYQVALIEVERLLKRVWVPVRRNFTIAK
jgi:hypothetical protein